MRSKDQRDKERLAQNEARKKEAMDVVGSAIDAWDKEDVRSLPSPEVLERATQVISEECGVPAVTCPLHNGHKIINDQVIEAARKSRDAAIAQDEKIKASREAITAAVQGNIDKKSELDQPLPRRKT